MSDIFSIRRRPMPASSLIFGLFLAGLAVIQAGVVNAQPASEESGATAESTQVPADEMFPPGTPTLAERLDVDPIENSLGIYGREGAETRVELYRCDGDMLCGRIVWLKRLAEPDGSIRRDLKNPKSELRNRRLIGLEVLWDLKPQDEEQSVWTKGRIYNPDDGKDYKARVEFLEDNKIELKACVFIVCETQLWMRFGDADAGTTSVASEDTASESKPMDETSGSDN